jgi:hypothetical protein
MQDRGLDLEAARYTSIRRKRDLFGPALVIGSAAFTVAILLIWAAWPYLWPVTTEVGK